MTLKIGTRGSPLALAQAYETQNLLAEKFPELGLEGATEIVVLNTVGDQVQDRPLHEVGGKGVFTKTLDDAMLDGKIDLGVHSMKDVPTWLPDGIILPCMLEREDVRDAFISDKAQNFSELPDGSVIGTTSLRRQSQILAKYPRLNVKMFRGNVQTRLRKLSEGDADATMLAIAGLNRMDMGATATKVLDPEDMLPAAGQGAIGITCREGDQQSLKMLEALNHQRTHDCVSMERAMLDVLDGSCRTPIAGYAVLSDDGKRIHLRCLLAEPDGSALWQAEREGLAADAIAMGRDAGAELRTAAGVAFFEKWADNFDHH